MKTADRIQQLRKARGLSQEALAEAIGVSRQAVSKWESEQSMPDIEKIILLSDYFDVSTDYLLKGIEESEPLAKKEEIGIFVILSTFFNFMGIIVSAAVWYEEQVAMAVVIGLILTGLGCVVFGIGLSLTRPDKCKKGKIIFWRVNIWLLPFLPLSFSYNVLFTGSTAPYPLPINMGAFIGFWVIYLLIGMGVNLKMAKVNRK